MAIAVIISGFGALDGQIVATTRRIGPESSAARTAGKCGGHPTSRLVGNTIAS